MRFALFVLFAGWPAGTSLAQGVVIPWEVGLSATTTSGEDKPFWLTSDQFGVLDRGRHEAAVRFSALLQPRRVGRFSWLASIDAVARASDHSTVFLQQAYAEFYAAKLMLRAGRREEGVGYVDPRLSLGSMLISSNAAPVTRVLLSTREWVGIPGTGRFVEVQARLGHGWMQGNRIVRNVRLHEKYLYFRVGGQRWPVRGIGGIVQYVQWAGTSSDTTLGRLPASFSDYLRILFVRPAKAGSTFPSEETNILGNSLGAYDFRLEIDLPWFLFSAYRQFYHEDTVSLRFRSPWDGLWGFGLTFPGAPFGVDAILYEHVFTKQQGSFAFERRGTDNYYNHNIYPNGWTHFGRTIGLPLMTTADGFGGVVNNIVIAHHLGVAGSFARALSWSIRATYSRNYGAHTLVLIEPYNRYETELPLVRKDQYSLSLELRGPLSRRHGLSGLLDLAYDRGDLLPDGNVGVTIGLSKSGLWQPNQHN